MNFITDNLLNIVLLAVTIFVAYNFWYEYFSKVNKISDEQLLDSFVTLQRKKRK